MCVCAFPVLLSTRNYCYTYKPHKPYTSEVGMYREQSLSRATVIHS